jgi:hypothetical protein
MGWSPIQPLATTSVAATEVERRNAKLLALPSWESVYYIFQYDIRCFPLFPETKTIPEPRILIAATSAVFRLGMVTVCDQGALQVYFYHSEQSQFVVERYIPIHRSSNLRFVYTLTKAVSFLELKELYTFSTLLYSEDYAI